MRTSLCLGLLLPAVCLSISILGCSSPDPARPSGFLERPDAMERVSAIPFQRIWSQKDTNWDLYRSVCVAPVRTDFLTKREVFATGDSKSKATSAGAKLEMALKEAFDDAKNKRYQLRQRPAVKTLLIELAIVEITPRLTAGEKSNSTIRGSLAFEGRISDAATGQVLATMADRRLGPSLISAPGIGYWGHVDRITKAWARDLVQALDMAGRREISGDWPFELKAWPRTRR